MRLVSAVLCVFLLFAALPRALCLAEPQTQAISAMLVEPATGTVLYEKNADEARPVASIIKMMIILLALEKMDEGLVAEDDNVSVSPNAASMGGSQALLDAGETQPFGGLLMSVIVASANDSAVAIAEHLYGSVGAAVEVMNARAAELGMDNTRYMNVTGLPAEGQHTTARDVSRLCCKIIRYPQYFEYSGIWMHDFVHNSGRITALTNTNRLVRFYAGADGIKTGSTNEAKYCVAATAERGGLRYIAVVLGSPSGKQRFADAETLLDYGFDNFELKNVLSAGEIVMRAVPVEHGAVNEVDLLAGGTVTALVPKTGEKLYAVRLDVPETLRAPLSAVEPVGEAWVLRGGEAYASVPVVPAASVPSVRFGDQIGRILSLWPALR